jgi:hypothetical protein
MRGINNQIIFLGNTELVLFSHLAACCAVVFKLSKQDFLAYFPYFEKIE